MQKLVLAQQILTFISFAFQCLNSKKMADPGGNLLMGVCTWTCTSEKRNARFRLA
jgi:hypothetical protein